MCLLISPSHTHTYTLTTQSDAHIDCLSDCSSGAPAAQIRSERIPSIFTRNFSSVGDVSTAAAFDCCGFLTTRLLAASHGQPARCLSKPARSRISRLSPTGAACCHFRSETETRSRSADRRVSDQFVDLLNWTGGQTVTSGWPREDTFCRDSR